MNTNELFKSLHRLNKQMHRVSHHTREDIGGLHHGQARLLESVYRHNGASQKEFVERMEVRAPSMTEMLTKLEEKGLISRVKDQEDQRITRIFITEEGKASVEKTKESFNKLSEDIFSSLSSEEQEQLLRLTQKLSEGLKEKYGCCKQGDKHHHEHHKHGKCHKHGEGHDGESKKAHGHHPHD